MQKKLELLVLPTFFASISRESISCYFYCLDIYIILYPFSSLRYIKYKLLDVSFSITSRLRQQAVSLLSKSNQTGNISLFLPNIKIQFSKPNRFLKENQNIFTQTLISNNTPNLTQEGLNSKQLFFLNFVFDSLSKIFKSQ